MNEAHDPEETRISRKVSETYRRTPPLDDAFRDRLERELAKLPAPKPRGRAWARRFGPLWQQPFAAAAALTLMLAVGIAIGRFTPIGPDASRPDARSGGTVSASASPGTRIVQFAIVAPGASRVSLVGDFNGWDPEANPMERQEGAGAWTAYVVLPAGRHVYAFVANGSEWINDPLAPLAPPNDFGVRNSVLIVGETTSL